MGDYEKELKRLEWLMDDVPTDEEPIASDSDGEIDNVSVNSEYPDMEQDGDHFPESNTPVTEDIPTENILGSVGENEENRSSENSAIQNMNKHYISKDGTRWKASYPPKNVRTRAENIIIRVPIIRQHARNAKSALECFGLFITNEMILDIVNYTNINIRETSSSWKNSANYNETSEIEIKALLGLLYLAGVFKSSHRLLSELWNTDGTGIDIFRTTMNLRRFQFLLRCLRFDNKNNRAERKKIDKLAPIRAIVDMFSDNCQAAYTPSQYLTIDEKLEMFRGRCSFRQYMPNKPAKYGLKIHALVDARTHYLLNMEVYVGNQPEGPFIVSNKPIDIVDRLVAPVSKTNRNITMDNWYTSYELFKKLRQDHKLTAVGTIRKNKRQIPNSFLNVKNREINSSLFGFQEDYTLVSYVPKKGKNVLLLSSLHHDDTIENGEKKLPEIIDFYNMTKGGVDVVDQLSSNYNVSRPSRRWPLTLFFSLLNTTGINAQIIYRENNNGECLLRRTFLTNLGLQLVAEHQKRRIENPRIPRELRGAIRKIQGQDEPKSKRTKQSYQGRCQVCPRKQDRKTKYVCKSCEMFLCLEHANIYCKNCEKLDSE